MQLMFTEGNLSDIVDSILALKMNHNCLHLSELTNGEL
jgi:hypothetical protein